MIGLLIVSQGHCMRLSADEPDTNAALGSTQQIGDNRFEAEA